MTRPDFAQAPSAALDLAVAAIRAQGRYGALTELAEDSELSRPALYRRLRYAESSLETAFGVGPCPEEIDGLQMTVTRRDLERTVLALRTLAPCSIRDSVDLMRVIYGSGWSHGTIFEVLHDAGRLVPELVTKLAPLLHPVDPGGLARHIGRDAVTLWSGGVYGATQCLNG